MKTALKILMAAILGIVILTTNSEATSILETRDYTVDCTGYFERVCHVRLSNSIEEPDHYIKLFTLLTSLDGNDIVYLHLAGNGGSAATAIQFVNILHKTPARTVAIVEGSVYSAHAYIAMAAKHLVTEPTTLFLFHRSSLYGQEEEVCSAEDGATDRTQDAGAKCRAFVQEVLKQDAAFVVRELSGFLTQSEIQGILNGDDLTITGDEIMKRLVANGDSRAH